jgi:hypothetical protein
MCLFRILVLTAALAVFTRGSFATLEGARGIVSAKANHVRMRRIVNNPNETLRAIKLGSNYNPRGLFNDITYA